MNTKKKKHSSLLYLVALFFVCCIGGGCLGFSIIAFFGHDLAWWQLFGRLLEGLFLVFLAFFLQVILHEAGHMVAGMLRGWSFMSFMILGLVLTRREGKFALSRFAIPGVGGQCLMIPPKDGDTDFGIAFYNAGGVLMNILVVIVSLVLMLTVGRSLPWEVNVMLGSLSFTGVLFALINGIPSCQAGIPNDGMNILDLRKDSFATHVFLTTMYIMGKLQQGCPVDTVMPGYLCEGLKIDYTNPIHVMAVNFDISLAVSRFDFERAHQLFKEMEPHEQEIVPIYQKEMLYEKVFLYLVSPRDEVDVGVLIDSDTLKYFEMQTAFRPTSLRVKYTFARMYECDEKKAAIIYQQFQHACDHYHIPGEVISEKKLVEYVKTLEPYES